MMIHMTAKLIFQASGNGSFLAEEGRITAYRLVTVGGLRNWSTATLAGKEQQKKEADPLASGGPTSGGNTKKFVIYWGRNPEKVSKDDGTKWSWTCFRPSDSYQANAAIDLNKHHPPAAFLDKAVTSIFKATIRK